MLPLHTFSIAAYDTSEGAWGAAVASKFLAAGAVVTWARAGAGAVATQSFANVTFGPRGLDLMEGGLSAPLALERLLADDPQREQRQVGLVDAAGGTASFTGRDCFAWAGGQQGSGYTVQGNILTGPQVIAAMAQAFESTSGDLAARLVSALRAGDDAGGDRRGKQSAAVLVVKPNAGYGGDNDRYIDLRVDDHPTPVQRLAELLDLHRLYFGSTPADQHLPIDAALARELQRLLARLGLYTGAVSGEWDQASIDAFWSFVGSENLEERWSPADAHRLDPVVLTFIRERF